MKDTRGLTNTATLRFRHTKSIERSAAEKNMSPWKSNAGSLMQRGITLDARRTLLDARDKMTKYGISRIVVVAEDVRPVGILTEKDIARILYYEVPLRRLDEITLEETMTRNPLTVNEEEDLKRCAKLMLEKNISSLVVVDKSGKMKGLFTKTDLVNLYAARFLGKHRVEEFMTKRVLTVSPDEPIHRAMFLMKDSNISRVIVTKKKRPLGVITGRDLLPMGELFGTGTFGKYWTLRQDLVPKGKAKMFIPSGMSAIFLSSDIMSRNPVTIREDEDLSDAGFIMLRRRISGLPVTDSDDRLRGIVTKTDVVKALSVQI